MDDTPHVDEMSVEMEMSRAFALAADYLEKHGWTQGKFTEPDGRACLVGALQQVTRHTNLVDPVRGWRGLDDLLQLTHHWYSGLTSWNDHAGRTKEEVVCLLRRAARNYGSVL